MAVGESIRELRRKKGLTQEELAERLHMSRQAVAKWESGTSEPSIECLIAISDLFEVSLDCLILGDEPNVMKGKKGDAPSKNINAKNLAKVVDSKQGTPEGNPTLKGRIFNRVDILLLILLISSIVVFIGLFFFAVLHPSKPLSSWYFDWDIHRGFWFCILSHLSALSIVVSLILFLKGGKRKKK